MNKQYAVIYDKGAHDGIEEEGSLKRCKIFVENMQSAFDKTLQIKPREEVRTLGYFIEECILGYEIE